MSSKKEAMNYNLLRKVNLHERTRFLSPDFMSRDDSVLIDRAKKLLEYESKQRLHHAAASRLADERAAARIAEAETKMLLPSAPRVPKDILQGGFPKLNTPVDEKFTKDRDSLRQQLLRNVLRLDQLRNCALNNITATSSTNEAYTSHLLLANSNAVKGNENTFAELLRMNASFAEGEAALAMAAGMPSQGRFNVAIRSTADCAGTKAQDKKDRKEIEKRQKFTTGGEDMYRLKNTVHDAADEEVIALDPHKRYFSPDFTPSSYDVISGIGKKYLQHEGNKEFQEYVVSKSDQYMDANKEEKAKILNSIVSAFRFVKLDHGAGLWYEVNKSCARAKISREFRDLLQNRHYVEHNYRDYAAEDAEEDTASHDDKPIHNGAFPLKLHAVLDQVEADGLAHIISWQPHGRCFVVHKPKEFVDHVMHEYFRTTKFASFQRQLYVYGFRRLTRVGRDTGGYYHELFLKGKPGLCLKMSRTLVKGTKFRPTSSPDKEPDFYKMKPVVDANKVQCDNDYEMEPSNNEWEHEDGELGHDNNELERQESEMKCSANCTDNEMEKQIPSIVLSMFPLRRKLAKNSSKMSKN